MVRGAPDGGQRLVAYWTPRGTADGPEPDLDGYLRAFPPRDT